MTALARMTRLIRAKPALLPAGEAVVSFTFDDFPASALHAGGAILAAHGARGTYYAALGLAGGDSPSGRIASLDEMAETARRGHELACHTHGHLRCGAAPATAILDDVARNAAAFARLGRPAPAHFAYPYGSVSRVAKRALARNFASCRSVRAGLNAGRIDLCDLKANSLYHGAFDLAACRRRIDEARRRGGWLIFYTHDVSPDPSPYGCTPAQLEAVVAHAMNRVPVRAVGAALDSLLPGR